ncbi:MAG: hypothetical protein EA387_13485, partial [Nitriliruptor sp.]
DAQAARQRWRTAPHHPGRAAAQAVYERARLAVQHLEHHASTRDDAMQESKLANDRTRHLQIAAAGRGSRARPR